jgi:hypothetical protein
MGSGGASSFSVGGSGLGCGMGWGEVGSLADGLDIS